MSNLWPSTGVLVRLSVAVFLFALGIPTGWLLHTAVSTRQEATAEPATRLIRGQSSRPWQFVNPLLECETAEPYLRQPGLTAARRRVHTAIDQHLKTGNVVHVSVYFRQLHDGPWFGINERDQYAPASLFKIPTLIAVLKRAEREPALLRRQLTFDETDDLNENMVYKPADTLRRRDSYTVEDLCRRMVAFSDNNAQRLLSQFVGEEQIDQVLLAIGVLPEFQGSHNTLSVKSLSSFFRILYNASVLSVEMSEVALEMLSHSSFRDGILAGVPPGVPVSSKYGELWISDEENQLHEFAIVYHRDHPYLLGVMAKGHDYERMKTFIRDLSRIVYEVVDTTPAPYELLPPMPTPD